MNITYQFAENVKQLYDGDNWTEVSVAQTVKDVDWKQAQQQTEASPNTIASLLNHLYYWNKIIMQRLEGSDPAIPESNGYDIEFMSNEAEWNELIRKTGESFMQLSEVVKNFPEDKLNDTYREGASSYYKTITGIIEHGYYHLGQIVILKNLVKTMQFQSF